MFCMSAQRQLLKALVIHPFIAQWCVQICLRPRTKQMLSTSLWRVPMWLEMMIEIWHFKIRSSRCGSILSRWSYPVSLCPNSNDHTINCPRLWCDLNQFTDQRSEVTFPPSLTSMNASSMHKYSTVGNKEANSETANLFLCTFCMTLVFKSRFKACPRQICVDVLSFTGHSLSEVPLSLTHTCVCSVDTWLIQ